MKKTIIQIVLCMLLIMNLCGCGAVAVSEDPAIKKPAATETDEAQENNASEELLPRPDGKEVCSYLRNIRKELAQANHIPYETEDCTFTGNCAGTCEKCDQEAAYLRDELNKIPEQDRKYPQHVLKDWKQALCSEK